MEKVRCKIDTPTHKKGEIIDRWDLEIDRLEYKDIYQLISTFELTQTYYA